MALLIHPDTVESASTMSTPSQLICRVCGHYALLGNTVHEVADGLGERLVCQICGAHRVV